MATDLMSPAVAEAALAWLTTLVWIVGLLASMARIAWRGFTRYPWPEWARPHRQPVPRLGARGLAP